MLTEFALTPSIFDEAAHEDKEAWRDQLRELIHGMFPRASAWPILVSDLHAGAWSSHVIPYVQQIQDHRARKYCQDILTNMKRMLVARPECGEWPGDDDIAWCLEAVASNEDEPIERILTVRSTKEPAAKSLDSTPIRTINEVEGAGFWSGINSEASPRRDLAEQVNLLHKICVHSKWVALLNPYGLGNEQNFTLELLDVAFRRNSKFGSVHFEVHTREPDEDDKDEKAKKLCRIGNDFLTKIKPREFGSSTVELYFWPVMQERIFIAGDFSIGANGRTKRPRWGVSMSHVARKGDPQRGANEWKLLSQSALDDWFREFVFERANEKPAPHKLPLCK